MALSMVDLGTLMPLFRAARRAMIEQMVTDRSASYLTGWYRHPPWSFWVRTIRSTARESFSRTFGSGLMPYTSARNSVANPWPYMGP